MQQNYNNYHQYHHVGNVTQSEKDELGRGDLVKSQSSFHLHAADPPLRSGIGGGWTEEGKGQKGNGWAYCQRSYELQEKTHCSRKPYDHFQQGRHHYGTLDL